MVAALLLVWHLCSTAASVCAPRSAQCACTRELEHLVERIEANYVGFHLAVQGARRAEWHAFVRAQGERATSASGEECAVLLQELVEWFGDGHLFVSEQGGAGPVPAKETLAIPDEELERIATGNGGELADLEGIWYSKEGPEYAVLRDPTGRRDFVAVLLDGDVPGWELGEIKAEFWNDERGGRRVRYRADDHSIRHFRARVWRGLLLHMPPVTWGRRLPLAPAQEGQLDSRDPRAPTLRLLGGGTIHVSIPSHSPEYAPAIDALVGRHREALAKA